MPSLKAVTTFGLLAIGAFAQHTSQQPQAQDVEDALELEKALSADQGIFARAMSAVNEAYHYGPDTTQFGKPLTQPESEQLAKRQHGANGTPDMVFDDMPRPAGGGMIPSPKACYPMLCPFGAWTDEGVPQIPDDMRWFQSKCAKVKGCSRKSNRGKCQRYCEVLKQKFGDEMKTAVELGWV